MKKLLSLALIVAMLFTVSTSVSAEPEDFIGSPSQLPVPELLEANIEDPEVLGTKIENSDCDGKIIVTPYGDKSTELSEKGYEILEKAHTIITNTPDLTTLAPGLAGMAAALGVSVSGLAVSALFDVTCTCEKNDYGTVSLTLKSDLFKNFVALLHYMNGEWLIVDGASVDDTILSFSVDSLSPFAVVVSTESVPADVPQSPQTGFNEIGFVACAVVFGTASVCLFIKSKKETA